MDTLVTRKVIVAKLVTRYLFQDQSWGAIVYRLIIDRVQLSPINNKLDSSSYLNDKVNRLKEYQDFIIRMLDIILACLAIVLLLPLLCLIAISVKTVGRGPIFFSHPRLGVDGRIFGCWKFRTMRIDARQQLCQRRSDSRPLERSKSRPVIARGGDMKRGPIGALFISTASCSGVRRA